MAKQNINVGVSANDGTGDTLRDGAIKINNVINELYSHIGDETNLRIDIGSPSTNQVLKWNGTTFTEGSLAIENLSNVDLSGIINGQVLKWNSTNSRFQPGDDLQGTGGGIGLDNISNNGNGDIVIDAHLLPNSDVTYDLGSPTLKFRDLYLSTATIWLDDTGLATDDETQELVRKKRLMHLVHDINTGAQRTITAKLSSENLIEQEKFHNRFSVMKVGTRVDVRDANGVVTHLIFDSYAAENGGARATAVFDAVSVQDQAPDLITATPLQITSHNKMLSEDETGSVQISADNLTFAGGKKLKIDAQGNLQVATEGGDFEDADGGFRREVNSAPVGSSVVKGHDGSSIYHQSPALLYRFTPQSNIAYLVQGPGFPGGGSTNPTMVMYRGFTYILHNLAGGSHPLRIQSTTGMGGTRYETGMTPPAGGGEVGVQHITVPMDAPNTLYYQCTFHPSMNGIIEVR
jgi:hypothetical protein